MSGHPLPHCQVLRAAPRELSYSPPTSQQRIGIGKTMRRRRWMRGNFHGSCFSCNAYWRLQSNATWPIVPGEAPNSFYNAPILSRHLRIYLEGIAPRIESGVFVQRLRTWGKFFWSGVLVRSLAKLPLNFDGRWPWHAGGSGRMKRHGRQLAPAWRGRSAVLMQNSGLGTEYAVLVAPCDRTWPS